MAEDNSSDSAPTLSTCSSAIVNSTTQVSSNLCTGSGQSSGDFDSEPTSVAADEHRSQNVQCYNAPYPQFVNPMYTPGVPSASTLQADMCDGIPGDDGSDNNTLHTAAESGQTVNVTPGDDNIEPDQPDEIQAGNSDGIRPCAVRYQEAAAEGGQTIDGDIGDDNIEPYAVCEEDVQMTVSPGHAPASDEKGNTVGQQQATCGYPPSSCTEVAERGGFDTQAFYVIDPDGPGRGVRPMFVHCDLDGQTAITLIGHDSETRTHVKGFEGRGSYSKNVTYWNSLEQVRAVVNQSSRCKQLIKYECHGSFIWKSNVRRHAWWVTWDGRQADYWGGASPGSGKCACGETGTCRGRCNCDVNDYTWREDSGFLSHKNDLPVTQLRFGDTGDTCVLPEDEEGYHTLGKLICYP
ncbi:PREDICTED: contactin-associated protein-like 2 isoform X5 [Branchiostoma belcheri]|uniref:Contactin-associated protein-like 2 isoform X5 n=1 Tax=Branchiostoma belcheri TaxID=7741 RepID=A0A6P4YG33_BRABE|nr:PREDICTED: contactin-associated protein-like 2 isoform X5 [Branchiostoma belcheri]